MLAGPQDMILRMLRATGTPSRAQPCLLVLTFHRVLPEPDPLLPSEPDARRFEALLRSLQRTFAFLPLREAVARLQAGTLPRAALVLTFDDGYANNHDVAAPILLRTGIPATVFVAPGYSAGGEMFNDSVIECLRHAPVDLDLRSLGMAQMQLRSAQDRVQAIDAVLRHIKHLEPAERARQVARLEALAGRPKTGRLMMNGAEVASLHRQGIEIGAHTVTHPILNSVDDDSALREISASRQQLEQCIGAPVTSFAYPNGRPHQDYSARHVAMVRQAGFHLAVSTAWGPVTPASDLLQMPRVAPWDRSEFRYALRLLLAYRDRAAAAAAAAA